MHKPRKDSIKFSMCIFKVLRDITIKIKDQDYLDFQQDANNSGLRVDEKISEIIQHYIIIERNRKRFSQSNPFSTLSTFEDNC